MSEPRKSAATLLVEIARGIYVFGHGLDGETVAHPKGNPAQLQPLGEIRNDLAAVYMSEQGKAPASAALADALAVLEGEARSGQLLGALGGSVAVADLEGHAILDQVDDFIRRFVVFPDEYCSVAVTLFAAHTHAVSSFYVTPRLILDSAEPESGKTRVLELLALLCRNPRMVFSTTVAALYRRLQKSMLTLLLDEADAIWSPKAGQQAEDLRAFVNAGYKRGATVDRCVGDASKMEVVDFPVFAPVTIAGIAGNLPATVTTRGVTIHMRRRAPGEHIEPYEEQDVKPEAEPLREALASWMRTVADDLRVARPAMPAGVTDRKAEVWRALLAVADAAEGDWPKRARSACEHFALGASAAAASLGIRLLADLRGVFSSAGQDRLPTVVILERLAALEEAPWGDLRGRPLDARKLAGYLRRYDVSVVTFDLLDGTGKKAKGYTTFALQDSVGLADAWQRYLSQTPASSVGNERNDGNPAGQATDDAEQVTATSVTQPDATSALTCEVTEVTDVTDESGPLSGDTQPDKAARRRRKSWTPGARGHCTNCGRTRNHHLRGQCQ